MYYTPSEIAKQKLPSLTFEEIRQYFIDCQEPSDDTTVIVFYMCYLCAQGDIANVKELIGLLGNDAVVILDTPHERFSSRAINVALLWNSGELGYEFFVLFSSLGATYHSDIYGYPWEQLGKTVWVDPFSLEVFGYRDDEEFIPLYDDCEEYIGYKPKTTTAE
jgi:hypothetical protein